MVMVNSGEHRGQQGRILKVMPEKERAIVEGLNIQKSIQSLMLNILKEVLLSLRPLYIFQTLM